jgi:hypothetical protein
METRQINFPALVKKAKKELANSAIAERYNSANPGSYIEVVEGTKEDREALIPMKPGESLQAYNPKKVRKREEKAASNNQTAEVPEKHSRLRKRSKSGRGQKGPEVETTTAKPPESKAQPDNNEEKAGQNEQEPPKEEKIKDINQELDKELNLKSSPDSSGANAK